MSDAAAPIPAPSAAASRWQSAEMRARVAKRYRSERLFRGLGLFAVLTSVAALVLLLGSMLWSGLPGFTQPRVEVKMQLAGSGLTLPAGDVDEAQATAALTSGGIADIVSLSATAAYGPQAEAWFGPAATRAAIQAIIADPALLQRGNVTLDLPASSALTAAARGHGPAELIRTAERLRGEGKLSTGFNWNFLTLSDATDPTMAGIKGALIGSLLTMLVTLAIAFPVGVLASLYLEEYAPRNRITDFIEVSINNLAAVPSIIFGLLALALFINTMGLCAGSPLVGGLTLALMTMPVIVISGRNAIKAVPPSIRDAALGVGASKVQVVFHHVLPLALPGILTGTIIGIARALGETAPLLLIGMRAFVTGAPDGLCAGSTVLPMQVFLWSDQVDPGFVTNTSAAIIVLLVVLLSMNAIAIVLRNRFEKTW